MGSFHPMAGMDNRWIGCCEPSSCTHELQEQAVVSPFVTCGQYNAHLQYFHPYASTTDFGRVDAIPRQWTCSNDYHQIESYDYDGEGAPDYTAMRKPACIWSLSGFSGPIDDLQNVRWDDNVESCCELRYYQQSDMSQFRDPCYLPHDEDSSTTPAESLAWSMAPGDAATECRKKIYRMSGTQTTFLDVYGVAYVSEGRSAASLGTHA